MNTYQAVAPLPAAAPGGAADANLVLRTVLIALRCWWKIAAPIGIVLSAGAVAGVIRFVDPTYTATAWVLIRERPDYLVSQNAFAQDPGKQLQNQLELMRSPLVLNAALQVKGVAQTPELIEEEDQVAALRNALKVRPQNRSDYYLVEFTSTSPQHAALVVNEVVDAFLDQQVSSNSVRVQKLIESLNDLRDAQVRRVETFRLTYETTSLAEVHTSPFSADSDQHRALEKSYALEMQKALTEAEKACQGLEFQIAYEKSQLESSSFEPLESEVENLVREDPLVLKAEAEIAADKKFLAGSKATAVKPQTYAPLEKRIAAAEADLGQRLVPEVREKIRGALTENARLIKKDRIKLLEHDLDQAKGDKKFYEERLAQVQSGQLESKGMTFKVEIAKATYDRAVKQLEAIDARIQGMQMEQQAPAPTEPIQDAAVPAAPDAELPFKQMGLAGAAAFFLPFGLAVGWEYLRRRVSSREQLEMNARMTVLGEVTTLPRRRRNRDADSRSQRELQLFEESIDGLRTFLTLRESMLGTKVIAVSSAISREGKTSIAAQLAVSLASASGERTLLIDGDMRSPDVSTIFGVECGPGLVDVLRGDLPVEEAIETDFNDTLHLLTAGKLNCSPHRLMGNGEFAALLNGLRSAYRYIVIDTPPILPASESLVMARLADVTVLCVRRDYSHLDQVTEAYQRLQHAGVKTAGAVLSGTPVRSYERRYGSYYYKRHWDA